MFGLSVVELLTGCSLIIIPLSLMIIGDDFFAKGSGSCQFAVISYNILIRTGVIIVCVISVMRYLMVCHQMEFSKTFWMIICSLAIVPILGTFIYSTVVMDGRPTTSYMQCGGLGNDDITSKALQGFVGVYMALQAWTITVCYLLICFKVYKKLKIFLNEAKANQDAESHANLIQQRNRLFKQVALVIIVYNLTYLFSYITQVLKVTIGYKRTPIVDAIVVIMVMFPSVCNPIVTLSFQPEVNNEFKTMLVKYWAKIQALFY